MRFARVTRYAILGMGILLSSRAFAETSATLQLGNPANLNGHTLKAGDYKLKWDDSSTNAKLSIMRGKNIVAIVPVRLVDLETPAAYDAALTWKNNSGPNTLIGIQLKEKR